MGGKGITSEVGSDFYESQSSSFFKQESVPFFGRGDDFGMSVLTRHDHFVPLIPELLFIINIVTAYNDLISGM